jgi:hypothetical protein
VRYNTDSCTVELSVRELCAMAHKSGDLDAAAPHHHTEIMRKGGELHRSLQKAEKITVPRSFSGTRPCITAFLIPWRGALTA